MSLLAPLDWGRQSLANLGEGGLGLLSGDFTAQNLLKLLPALAGVGAGLATGGIAGAPVGSLVASLLQGAGVNAAPQTFQAPTTGSMLQSLGGDPESFWQNLLLGAATDPWTYTGIGLGARAGSRAGSAVGEAAVARGPRYATTSDDIARMLDASPPNPDFFFDSRMAHAIENNPRLRSEIPPWSSMVGHGGEAIVFGKPGAGAVRVSSDVAMPGRPAIPEILQPTTAVDVPAGGYRYRVEHLPWADKVPTPPPPASYMEMMLGREADSLKDAAMRSGVEWLDPLRGNIGLVGGDPVIIDPGLMSLSPGYSSGYSATSQAREPGAAMRLLLDLIGADSALRRIDQGASALNYQTPARYAGGAVGGSVAPLLRALRGE